MNKTELTDKFINIMNSIQYYHKDYSIIFNNRPYMVHADSNKVLYLNTIKKDCINKESFAIYNYKWSINDIENIEFIGSKIIPDDFKELWIKNHKNGEKIV